MKIFLVPSSLGCLDKNIGCEKAPEEIIKVLKKIEMNENGNIINFDLEKIKVNENDIEETMENIFNNVDEGIVIGGDHSITYSCFKKFSKKYKNPGLVMFDAHADCVNDFKITHEDFVKVLIKEGVLKKENLIYVGLRQVFKKEHYFLKENNIRIFDMKKVASGIRDVCDIVMENARKFDGLYVSIDIDVLDPGCAPGTGYLSAGGMSVRQLLYFIQRFKNLKNLKMIDLVEINPDKDVNNMTVEAGAKIVGELI